MFKIKNIVLFFFLVSLIKSEDESILIKAKFYPKLDKIVYNGNTYTLSPSEVFQEDQQINNYIPQKRFLEEIERSALFSGAFWFNLIVFITLACFAGTMSGLTVGYLSIDSLVLEIKMSNGTENEKYYAEKIYKLVDNHHWLLVTLLLCNSFACEAMPIFLSKLVNEMMAIVLSVTVLLFVGEIIPQALCTGPNQMKIASILAPFTYLLMIITYPISYPIAMFMDYVIGVHGKNRFCNSDLKSLIELHVKEVTSNLSTNQVGYFKGFSDKMNKPIGELILPMEKVLKIDFNTKINKITLKKLIDSGYSRIPVFKNNTNQLIGILSMKQLVGKDLSKPQTLSQLEVNLSHAIHAYEDTLFLDLLEKLKAGKSHMAFIHQQKTENNFMHSVSCSINVDKRFDKNISLTPIKGIITLEDLIEFLFEIPIFDEEDYESQHKNIMTYSNRKKNLSDTTGNETMDDKLNKLYDSDTKMKQKDNNNEITNKYYGFKDGKGE